MDYSFSRRDDFREGTKVVDNPRGQSTSAHIFSAEATYAAGQEISFRGSIPLINFVTRTDGDRQSSTDFGDLSLSAQVYAAPRLFGKPTNLFYALGVTLPAGGGVSNPVTGERNFASGTVDPFASILGVVALVPAWSISGAVFTRQIVAETSDESKTGDFYSASFGLNYQRFDAGLIGNVRLRYVNRGQDRYDGQLFASSGGEWTYFDVGLTKDILGEGEHAFQLWLLAEVPVHQYVKGAQLTESWNLRVGVNLGLTLFGDHNEESNLPFNQ